MTTTLTISVPADQAKSVAVTVQPYHQQPSHASIPPGGSTTFTVNGTAPEQGTIFLSVGEQP